VGFDNINRTGANRYQIPFKVNPMWLDLSVEWGRPLGLQADMRHYRREQATKE
jgi:hypothetical protein